jgi:uncharacterized protein
MQTINHTWEQLTGDCIEIIRQMQLDNFKPDYIIGVTRGGLMPAVLISQYLSLPLYPLNISLRDHYNDDDTLPVSMLNNIINGDRNALVIDDINDTGATFTLIHDQILPYDNVKFASIFDKLSSEFDADYYAREINLDDNDCWVNFCWEQFWMQK